MTRPLRPRPLASVTAALGSAAAGVLGVVVLATLWLVLGAPLPTAAVLRLAERLGGVTLEADAVRLQPGWPPLLALENARLRPARDEAGAPSLEIGRAVIDVDLAASLESGTLRLDSLELQAPSLLWSGGLGGAAPGGSAAPVEVVTRLRAIDTLSLTDGRLRLRLPTHGVDLELRALAVDGRWAADDGLRVEGSGEMQGEPLRLEVRLEPAEGGRWRLRTNVDVGATSASLEAALDQETTAPPPLSIDVAVPSLDALPVAFGLGLPPTGAGRIAGRLRPVKNGWRLDAAEATLGERRFAGWLAWRSNRLRLDGELHLPRLRLGGAGRDGGDFDQLLRAAALIDGALDLRIDEVTGLPVALTDLRGRLTSDGAEARLDDLRATLAGAPLEGRLHLDATASPARVTAELAVAGMALAPWLRDGPLDGRIDSILDGEVALQGRGDAIGEVLDTLGGTARAYVGNGEIDRSMVRLAGLDVIGALLLPLTASDVPIRCGLLDVTLENGVVVLEQAVVGTPDSRLVGDGSIDLAARRLSLSIEPRAKDFGLLDGSAPVQLEGPLLAPEVRVGQVEALPLVELGGAEALDCPTLAEQVEDAGTPPDAPR